MMLKRGAVAAALMAAALSCAPVAHGITVTGPVTGLDVTRTAECGTIDATIVITATRTDDKVAGTVFTLEKLAGIDLTTQAGWDAVKDMDVDKARAAEKAGSWIATTGTDGKAHFADLPIGAYLVTAVAPEGSLTPAPFVITLPTGAEGRWDCAPVINAKFSPTTETTTPTKPEYPPYEPPTTPPDEVRGIHNNPEQKPEDKVLGIRKNLAYTGAAVTGIVALAAGLFAVGLVMVRRRKTEE
ncbi:SpaA isopeptide-forming pilin-related protein [Corynebacterium sp. H130]|uniref:SpaA isopeptide-forming pilin-related protein n=1 Tax=Corynebacterium sp. H130 TaxID=3133444 RepID=UPI0030ABF1CA